MYVLCLYFQVNKILFFLICGNRQLFFLAWSKPSANFLSNTFPNVLRLDMLSVAPIIRLNFILPIYCNLGSLVHTFTSITYAATKR